VSDLPFFGQVFRDGRGFFPEGSDILAAMGAVQIAAFTSQSAIAIERLVYILR
jgi:hypothetical protein